MLYDHCIFTVILTRNGLLEDLNMIRASNMLVLLVAVANNMDIIIIRIGRNIKQIEVQTFDGRY